MSDKIVKRFEAKLPKLEGGTVIASQSGVLRAAEYIEFDGDLSEFGSIAFFLEVEADDEYDQSFEEQTTIFRVIRSGVPFDRLGLRYWTSVKARAFTYFIYEIIPPGFTGSALPREENTSYNDTIQPSTP